MVDVFDEIDDQIRQERFRALVRRSVPYFIGALVLSVLVVLGVWAYGQFKMAGIGKASEAYAHGLDLMQQGDQKGAMAQFEQAAKGPAGYRSLALMQEASVLELQNNTAEAVQRFDAAAKAAPDQMIGDVARLKAAYALMDTASLSDMTARLTPLMAEGRPYRAQAREALAIAKVGAGQLAQAKSDLAVLQLMSDTPESERQRAAAIIGIIDSGTAKSVKALAQVPILQPPPPPPQPALGAAQAPPADNSGN